VPVAGPPLLAEDAGSRIFVMGPPAAIENRACGG